MNEAQNQEKSEEDKSFGEQQSEAPRLGYCMYGGIRIPANESRCIDGRKIYCYPTGAAIDQGPCEE